MDKALLGLATLRIFGSILIIAGFFKAASSKPTRDRFWCGIVLLLIGGAVLYAAYHPPKRENPPGASIAPGGFIGLLIIPRES